MLQFAIIIHFSSPVAVNQGITRLPQGCSDVGATAATAK